MPSSSSSTCRRPTRPGRACGFARPRPVGPAGTSQEPRSWRLSASLVILIIKITIIIILTLLPVLLLIIIIIILIIIIIIMIIMITMIIVIIGEPGRGWCVFRKGANGVSTNGVTAEFMCFDRGTFWHSVQMKTSTNGAARRSSATPALGGRTTAAGASSSGTSTRTRGGGTGKHIKQQHKMKKTLV